MAQTSPPKGCGSGIGSIYYNLCDLTMVWGVVVEALAATGVMTSFVLFVILMAYLPFATDKKRKGMVALQASVLVFTLGLFGLTFAFVVGRYSASCAARRFLFGVLFSGCLACLVMHGLWLALLERRGRGPRSWLICLGALSLWLVEVIINTEWLLITVLRNPPGGDADVSEPSCSFANQDFVMALIYVMVLLVATVLMAVPSLTHKYKQWRRDAAFLLASSLFTVVIWVAWIVMYVHANRVLGEASWDDPTLAVAVVSNAWVFLLLYAIPEICLLTQGDLDLEHALDEDHSYPVRSLVYDIHKEPGPPHQTVYMENKAFTMEEPPSVPTKPVSPYGAYNGQLRSCVYQPTEIALIAKGLTKMDQDTMMRRASAASLNPCGASNSSLHLSVGS
ncbi:G-protein coupled receptor family C group 5 member C-like [Entelurus aequoreus]|uniref:G-protein coupled receptor family C group 5 member C-like n=1 Tax=Entelurus aequoreus TaxID=161455 RepID=UPI002B1E3583|nr:G-protein coupled receptor family C group 5 member C-like [Entelurus aequoreus]